MSANADVIADSLENKSGHLSCLTVTEMTSHVRVTISVDSILST